MFPDELCIVTVCVVLLVRLMTIRLLRITDAAGSVTVIAPDGAHSIT